MSQVVPNAEHRARLLLGLAEGIKEDGYRATTVADIVRRARTSRRTFYQHFTDREHAFRELSAVGTKLLAYRIRESIDQSQPWDVRIDQGIRAYLDVVAESPEVTVTLWRERQVILGGPDQKGSRDAVAETAALIVDVFEQTVGDDEEIHPISMEAAIVVTAGLAEIIARTVESGGDIRALRPLAVEMITAFARSGARAADPAH